MRLIDADAFLAREISRCHCVPSVGSSEKDYESLKCRLEQEPTIDAELPTPGVTKHEKIRTPLAKIIVGESFGKPYYEIMWFSMDYEKCDIGYGSFSLDIVRDYLKGEFEIIEQDSAHDVAPVVRCKDCQSWKRNVGLTDSPNGHCFEHDIDTNGQDFFSYGERRDGGPEDG